MPPLKESKTPSLKPINPVNIVISLVDENVSVLCYSSRLIIPILVVLKPCFKGDLVRQRKTALHKHVEKINHQRLEYCREES